MHFTVQPFEFSTTVIVKDTQSLGKLASEEALRPLNLCLELALEISPDCRLYKTLGEAPLLWTGGGPAVNPDAPNDPLAVLGRVGSGGANGYTLAVLLLLLLMVSKWLDDAGLTDADLLAHCLRFSR